MSNIKVTFADIDGESSSVFIKASDIQLKEGIIAFVDEDDNITLMIQAGRLISAIPFEEAVVGKTIG